MQRSGNYLPLPPRNPFWKLIDLQRETLTPSTPTGDKTKSGKIPKPYLPWIFLLACQGNLRASATVEVNHLTSPAKPNILQSAPIGVPGKLVQKRLKAAGCHLIQTGPHRDHATTQAIADKTASVSRAHKNVSITFHQGVIALSLGTCHLLQGFGELLLPFVPKWFPIKFKILKLAYFFQYDDRK